IQYHPTDAATRGLRICLVLLHREVVCVRVVWERSIADSETGADYRLLVEAVCNPPPRREILVVGVKAEIRRVAADSGYLQRVVDWVELRESRVVGWCSRRVQFPAQADIESQFGRDLPLVLNKEVELPGPVSRENDRIVAACV